MKLHIKEETRQKEGRPGAPVAAGLHVPLSWHSVCVLLSRGLCHLQRAFTCSGLFKHHLGKISPPHPLDVFLPFKRVVTVKINCV